MQALGVTAHLLALGVTVTAVLTLLIIMQGAFTNHSSTQLDLSHTEVFAAGAKAILAGATDFASVVANTPFRSGLDGFDDRT